jgi:curved DNA-binding protein CbpA
MAMLTMKLTDYYLVLGIPRNADVPEIKDAYHRRAKELYPDRLGPDATQDEIDDASALFAEAAEAYDVLSNKDKRKTVDDWLKDEALRAVRELLWGSPVTEEADVDVAPTPSVPQPERIDHDGVRARVIYGLDYLLTRLTATVRVSADDVFKIVTAPALPYDAVITQFEVVDFDDKVIASGHSLQSMRDRYRRFRAEEKRDADKRDWETRLEELRTEAANLRAQGLPTKTLEDLFRDAEIKQAGAFRWEYSDSLALTLFANWGEKRTFDARGHRYGHSRDSVTQAIREVEKEIERLKSQDLSEALLQGLLAGKITHPDVRFNNQLIEEIYVLSIRSGGEIPAFTQEAVEQHYRERLSGISSADHLLTTNLRLPDEREFYLEAIAEGLIELAPDQINIAKSENRFSSYPVEYGFEIENGRKVAVGVVTVPLVVYEYSCSKCGVKTTFPKLPHDIRLLIRVKVNDGQKEVISDAYPDGQDLQTEVQRCLNRKTRRGVEVPVELPPWHVGRIRRP